MCWTKWLNANGTKVKKLRSDDLKRLYAARIRCRDRNFGWTATHGIAGASPSFRINTMLKFFEYLKNERLEEQLCTKDNEGDIPLQSAINSGAGAEVVRLILTVAPDLTKRMLCSSNNKGDTPLQTAFEQREWCAVEVILEFCIQNNVLSHLTGVKPQAEYNNTLLHRAFKRGYVEYLGILLEVCRARNVEILPVLLVLNKKKETAWYHLANRSAVEQKKALSLVKDYNIDVNQLYLDPDTRSTLLHKAYRRNNKETVVLLKQYNANEDQVDRRGLLPRERTRSLSLQSASRSESPDPLAPAPDLASTQDPLAPARHLASTQDPLAPARHLASTQDPLAPARHLASTQDPLAPARHLASTQDPLAPARHLASTQDPLAPSVQELVSTQDQLAPTRELTSTQDLFAPTIQESSSQSSLESMSPPGSPGHFCFTPLQVQDSKFPFSVSNTKSLHIYTIIYSIYMHVALIDRMICTVIS